MNEIGKNVYDNLSIMPFDLQGWGGNNPIFEKLITRIKPSSIIEVGTWKGQSAINMANIVKAQGLNCKIYCVDTWLGSLEFWDWLNHTPERDLLLKNGYPQVYYQFLSNVVHCNHQDIIVPVPLPSNLAAKLLKKMEVTADLIYIDASHEEDDVYADICSYKNLLSENGVLFGDDYGWYSVKCAVDRYQQQTNCGIEILDTQWMLTKPNVVQTVE